jgi:glyoxylase-like metal-dependent hydrolase (beta-lactamase superfamily II)
MDKVAIYSMFMSGRVKEDEPFHEENRKYPYDSSWFEIKGMNDTVTAIREPHHAEDVISYVLNCGGNRACLVDTGMGVANIRNTSPVQNVDALVLLTHTHWDHMGGASEFPKVAVFDDPFEIDRLRKGWLPQEIVGYKTEEVAIERRCDAKFPIESVRLPGVKHWETFSDGQTITIGTVTLEIIHTPGHTPGSVCFFDPENGFLFTGDTLYPGPIYLHLPESDVVQFADSIRRLYERTRGRLTKIFPGHNAFESNPSLLEDFVRAVNGTQLPNTEKIEDDEFGPNVRQEFGVFSLKIPR